MTPRARLTSLAEQDITDIWLFIARDNVEAADRIIDRFTETFRLLANRPNIGSCQDRYRKGLRAFLVSRYVVFFQPEPEGILVYRVLHGARSFEGLL